jgi:hypothetical protein
LHETADSFRVGRLEDVGVEAGGEDALPVVVAGEGDEADGGAECPAYLPGHAVAVEQGHVDVRDDDIGPPGQGLPHAFQAVVRLLDNVSLPLQDVAEAEADVVMVVDEEDSLSRHGWFSVAAGKVNSSTRTGANLTAGPRLIDVPGLNHTLDSATMAVSSVSGAFP